MYCIGIRILFKKLTTWIKRTGKFHIYYELHAPSDTEYSNNIYFVCIKRIISKLTKIALKLPPLIQKIYLPNTQFSESNYHKS